MDAVDGADGVTRLTLQPIPRSWQSNPAPSETDDWFPTRRSLLTRLWRDGTDNVEIIGLVKDIKRMGMIDAPRGEMYRTYRQMDWCYKSLVVRTQRDPAEMTRAVRLELDTI